MTKYRKPGVYIVRYILETFEKEEFFLIGPQGDWEILLFSEVYASKINPKHIGFLNNLKFNQISEMKQNEENVPT